MNRSFQYLAIIVIITGCASCLSSPKSKFNKQASLTSSDQLPENPLLLIPFASSINLNDTTMSTLYGNEIAATHARTGGDSAYPKGSLLYEVTWKQQPDSVWYGARIPAAIFSVERILFEDGGTWDYDLYEGRPLRKLNLQTDAQRVAFICSQRMAVSP